MSGRALLGRIRRRLNPPRVRPLILMYHRVADLRVDPWDLAVHPETFAAQLAVLQETRQPFTMSAFVERARGGDLPANAVAVTFDDGYADNLRQARPRLAAAGVPATLFLATGFVGQRVEYWWDELARGILERDEALDEAVSIGETWCRLSLPAVDDAAGQSASWRAAAPPRTERERLFYALWERLRLLRASVRDEATQALRAVLQVPAPRPDDLPMDAAEVRALASDEWFEIAGHTASHPVLPSLSPAERRDDIGAGRAACERLIGRVPVGFAYPFGANDADSRAAVADCGFGWACTTQAAPLPASIDDWFALPRVAVCNWDAATFAHALEGASA